MGLWFTENHNNEIHYSYNLKDVLFAGQSEFQKVEVVETVAHGRMLVIDDCVMITDEDEFVYHEMIAHIPACLHGNPRKALVIGGGDGGTIRELLKHDDIEQVTLCEIDQMVVDASREFFPKVAGMLDDPRVNVVIGDGIAHMSQFDNELDLIVIDSTDPIGPGEGLFSREFYASVHKALKADGVMVAQSESPWYNEAVLKRIQRNIRGGGFSWVRPYLGPVPTYPSGLWSWTVAAKRDLNVQEIDRDRLARLTGLKYLTADVLLAAFAMPPAFAEKFEA